MLQPRWPDVGTMTDERYNRRCKILRPARHDAGTAHTASYKRRRRFLLQPSLTFATTGMAGCWDGTHGELQPATTIFCCDPHGRLLRPTTAIAATTATRCLRPARRLSQWCQGTASVGGRGRLRGGSCGRQARAAGERGVVRTRVRREDESHDQVS